MEILYNYSEVNKVEIKDLIIRIKQARERANLSARELSLRLGKNNSYINKVENKEFCPPIDMLFKIIECCNLTPEEFFYKDFLSYQEDKALLKYFNKLTKRQKQAILNLYETNNCE